MQMRRTHWIVVAAALLCCGVGGWWVYREETSFPTLPAPGTSPQSTHTVVELTRTGCFGPCPSYSVRVLGDGTVIFEGQTNVFASGPHVAHLSASAAASLLDRFRQADFFALRDGYYHDATDLPTYTLRVSVGERTKKVEDYDGEQAGMPKVVRVLEDEVDRVAGTDRWIRDTPGTLPALLSEGWDFNANTLDNRNLLRSALKSNDDGIIARYSGDHLDVLDGDRQDAPLICAASAAGRIDMVRRMLDSVSARGLLPETANQCLASAAASGNMQVFQLWLDHRASVYFKDSLTEEDALPSAIKSGNPAMVAAVLKLAPSLAYHNLHDVKVYETPLLEWVLARWTRSGRSIPDTAFEEIVEQLVRSGAQYDSEDSAGNTLLMNHVDSEPVVRALLAGGADPTHQNQFGRTALDLARDDNRCPVCLALLEEAVLQKQQQSLMQAPAAAR